MELGERLPGDPPLPAELRAALDEWSAFSTAVAGGGRPEDVDLLRRRGRQLASRVADVLGRPVEFVDPVTGAIETVRVSPVGPIPRLAVETPGPVPWTTGLTVAAFVAVLVGFTDIVLSNGFAEAFGLLWIPANLLVGFGLAPTLWLVHDMPFWRWPALGTAVGLGVGWVVLLLGMLG
ncbi:DUF2537 domain-containing protein [Pseudonocardia sp. TRM90224]|uniref:DUF2537 domain-containing protein n=1 Tax=Pseudonocardia sp. TRM90224 TaxID=2812678 RepID=UPI001E622713|nr:DUF2537 domain-containing protein [Pseudonocardia sp. TRM90224]